MDTTDSGQRFTGDEELSSLLDHLYTVAPDDFVAIRDAIVRALRGRKRRDEAGDVAGRRRPTLAAWAVNQAVRSAPERLGALRAAGTDLQRELRRAMSGVDRGGVGAASRHRRAQINGMTQLALGYLADAGHDAEAHREAVAATFDAASADEHAGSAVARGELSKPMERPSEFGALTALQAVDDPPSRPAPTMAESGDGPGGNDERRRAAAEALEQARRRADEAGAESDRAVREAGLAAGELETAEREQAAAAAALERAQLRMEHATTRAEAVRAAALRARTAADEAIALAAQRTAALAETERAAPPPAD